MIPQIRALCRLIVNCPRPDEDKLLPDKSDVSTGAELAPEAASGWSDIGSRSALAERYIYLAILSQTWVNRRVDRFDFVGAGRIHQRTSIDFTTPDHAPLVATHPEPSMLIPLMQVVKRPLTEFDIVDEHGQEVPVLTARQTRTLSSIALLALADSVLDIGQTSESLLLHYVDNLDVYEAVDIEFRTNDSFSSPLLTSRKLTETQAASLQRHIISVVTSDSDDGLRHLREFESAFAQRNSIFMEGDPEADPYFLLWKNDQFRSYARKLAQHYYLTACLRGEYSPGSRRVIKVRFTRFLRSSALGNDRISTSQVTSRTLRIALGRLRAVCSKIMQWACLWPFTVLQEASQAADAQSYHIELAAPNGTKVVQFRWLLRPQIDRSKAANRKELRKVASELVLTEVGKRPVEIAPEIVQNREHTVLHSTIRTLPLGYSAVIVWKLSPNSNSWLLVATLSSIMITMISAFLIGATRLSVLHVPPTSGISWIDEHMQFWWMRAYEVKLLETFVQNRAGVVIGLIALAVGALLRTGEHPLVKRLLFWPRLCVMTTTLGLLVAAVPLTITFDYLPSGSLYWDLAGLFLIASVLCCALLVGAVGMSLGIFRKVRRRFKQLLGRPDTGWRVWI